MKYNRELMMAILWGRMDYLGEVMNVEIISLEKAPEAYHIFDDGSPKKFVIDPHGSVAKKRPLRRPSRARCRQTLATPARILPERRPAGLGPAGSAANPVWR